MDKQEKTRQMILQLKTIKEDKELSNQDIFDMVIASGGVTSLSTVRRVFSEGSENMGFNYRNTIQPISHALLAVSESEKVTELTDSVLQAQLDGLKQACELKDSIIEAQQKELEAERAKVAHLVKEIERLGKMLDKLLD